MVYRCIDTRLRHKKTAGMAASCLLATKDRFVLGTPILCGCNNILIDIFFYVNLICLLYTVFGVCCGVVVKLPVPMRLFWWLVVFLLQTKNAHFMPC